MIIGPPGTKSVVDATLVAFGSDIGYRIAHHGDLNAPPDVRVHEHTDDQVWDSSGVTIRAAPTDHRPVEPTIAFRVEYAGASVVLAGDGTLVLTHYVPAIAPLQEDQWKALAAKEFAGRIELGDDLHQVEVHP